MLAGMYLSSVIYPWIGRTDNAVVASKVKTDLKFYVKTDLEGEKKTENSVKKHKKSRQKYGIQITWIGGQTAKWS